MTSARRLVRPRTEKPELQIRDRLLQAAHELIAEKGLAGFKVIDVASRAGANVAMINYHFGSRDLFLGEVVRLSAVRVAQVRAERLEQLIAGADAGLPSLEAVLRCWLEPFFESSRVRSSAACPGRRRRARRCRARRRSSRYCIGLRKSSGRKWRRAAVSSLQRPMPGGRGC